MENIELYLKNLTGKDEQKAQEAACFLVDNISIDLFKALVEKTDFLFDFVRNNVAKRITKVVRKSSEIEPTDSVMLILKAFGLICIVVALILMIVAVN